MRVLIICLIFLEFLFFLVLYGVDGIFVDKNNIANAISPVKEVSFNDINESNNKYIRKVFEERGMKDEFISSVLSTCNFRFNKLENGRILGTYNTNTKEIIIYRIMYFGNDYMFTERNEDTLVHESIHCYLYNNKDIYEKIKLIYSRMNITDMEKFYYAVNIVGEYKEKTTVELFVNELTAYTFSSKGKEYEGEIGDEIRKILYK